MDALDARSKIIIDVRGSDPVPWSAPHVSRFGGAKPNVRLVAWQDKIRDAAREAFGPYGPWTGPIGLTAHFFISRAAPKDKYGSMAIPSFEWDEVYSRHAMTSKPPDLTNLIKAAEDALEEIVYVNDAQVCFHDDCKSLWMSTPGVMLTISR